MTNEERDLITQFIQRVGGAPATAAASGGFSGSVPTTAPQLPPIDREADGLMAELFTKYPEARYRITQLAFVQEHALAQAQGRIAQLTQQLQQMSQQQSAPQPGQGSPWGNAGQPQPQGAPPQSRGFFGSLFGGGAAPQQPQPYQQPQYAPPPMQAAPGYQPGMFQRGGSGFLGSALTTAAGVAGGMVAGNALMGLFEGGHHGGDASGAGFGGAAASGAAPWGAPVSDPYNLGGAPKDDSSAGFGTGVTDNSSWSTPDQGSGWQQPASDPGWTDASAAPDDGGGWTDSSDSNT